MRPEYQENLKQWLELAKHIHDEGGQAVECWDKGSGIGEMYHRGHVACHIHLLLKDALRNGGTQDYCAHFQAVTPQMRWLPRRQGFDMLIETLVDNHAQAVSGAKEITSPRESKNWGKHTVFVNIGKVTQQGQLVDISATPTIWTPCQSMIRLQPLDDCSVFRGYIPRVTVTLPEEFFLAIRDGKLHSPLLLRSKITALVVESQLKCQMVEGAAEIVNNITNKESNIVKKRPQVRDAVDIHNILAALCIKLGSESWEIGFDRERLPDIPLKGISVLFSTIDLSPTAVEGDLIHGLSV
jgi:hypothetical protein